MESAREFTDLIVWQKGHRFVLGVYRATSLFPKNELYGLVSQFRRAAVSIPANIAEGFKKKTLPDKSKFLNIAEGSLEECRYYLILAHDLNYMDNTELMEQIKEVARLLHAYRRAIESNIRRRE